MMITIRCLVLFLCSWLFTLSALATEIQVSVDRNPVGLNESFEITFSSSEDPDGNPDFAPLNTDFQILNQQRSSNMSWVNGKTSRNQQWTISVLARQAGELWIPPIAFGADTSKPLKISVTDAQPVQSNYQDIFLEVQATPEKPYVQSQVLFSLKLYRRVQITQASLTEPEIKDAVVEKLGEDSTYSTQVNGMDYWVTERKFAIFPQQSGLFTIAPLSLTAEVAINQRPRFNGFFNRQQTETRRVSSKALTLNVQPVPKEFTDPAWLSAESLQLSENWSDDRLQTKVGEPLTRTITLNANGATVGQLPELVAKQPIEGIKTYPDQPVLNEDKQSDGLIALREEKVAYIPSKAGEYVLPAIAIQWFNTKTQKIEVARLPEVKIKALSATAPNTGTGSVLPMSPAQQDEQAALVVADTSWQDYFWPGLSGFLGLGWLLTLIRLLRIQRKPANKASLLTKRASDFDQKILKTACLHHNPQAAKQALLQWGKQRYAADNLSLLSTHCSESLQNEILALNHYLYRGNDQNWNGRSLWEAFCKANAQKQTIKQNQEILEPLNRIS